MMRDKDVDVFLKRMVCKLLDVVAGDILDIGWQRKPDGRHIYVLVGATQETGRVVWGPKELTAYVAVKFGIALSHNAHGRLKIVQARIPLRCVYMEDAEEQDDG